jgi:O-methyltransferase domain
VTDTSTGPPGPGGGRVADRCDIAAGSFFDHVPSGGEAYIVKSILHDWDDTASTQLLHRIGEASQPGAALLFVERTLADVDPSPVAAMSDLNMMVNTGGRRGARTHHDRVEGPAPGRWLRTHPVDRHRAWMSVLEATKR